MLLAVSLCAPWTSATAGENELRREAEQLLRLHSENLARLDTIVFECETIQRNLDSKGRATGDSMTRRSRVSWDKSRRKLSWTRDDGKKAAYFVDAEEKIALSTEDSGTAFLDGYSDDYLEQLTTPFPAWLWRAEVLLPPVISGVRVEGELMVVTTSDRHPKREIKFDRATSRLAGFQDTDATGRTIRWVECHGWGKRGEFYVPALLTEKIQARRNGLTRTVRFSGAVVNEGVPEYPELLVSGDKRE